MIQCKNCIFYEVDTMHACVCPKMFYGYKLQPGSGALDAVNIEDNDGWGMLPGPEFGCIHGIQK